MKITRTVHGFVSQVYDTEKKRWVDQEFIAGDEEWESDGEVSEDEELEDMPEVKPPQMLMVQPEPPKKCVRVEYDLTYWGGDYSKVGQFAYVPYVSVDRMTNVLRRIRAQFSEEDAIHGAFQMSTGIAPCHIVSYNMDEPVDQDGNDWRDK